MLAKAFDSSDITSMSKEVSCAKKDAMKGMKKKYTRYIIRYVNIGRATTVKRNS